jgi:hypothetical protein
MSTADEKHRSPDRDRKKPWASPRLVVHGDLRTLTRAKGGTKQDGGVKPNTRATGGPA